MDSMNATDGPALLSYLRSGDQNVRMDTRIAYKPLKISTCFLFEIYGWCVMQVTIAHQAEHRVITNILVGKVRNLAFSVVVSLWPCSVGWLPWMAPQSSWYACALLLELGSNTCGAQFCDAVHASDQMLPSSTQVIIDSRWVLFSQLHRLHQWRSPLAQTPAWQLRGHGCITCDSGPKYVQHCMGELDRIFGLCVHRLCGVTWHCCGELSLMI